MACETWSEFYNRTAGIALLGNIAGSYLVQDCVPLHFSTPPPPPLPQFSLSSYYSHYMLHTLVNNLVFIGFWLKRLIIPDQR